MEQKVIHEAKDSNHKGLWPHFLFLVFSPFISAAAGPRDEGTGGKGKDTRNAGLRAPRNIFY